MNYKNLTLLSLLALTTFGSIVIYNNQLGNRKTISNKFAAQVNSLEQQTWKSLEKVGISKDEIYKKVHEYHKKEKKPQNDGKISLKLRKLITSLADYFKIDASKIVITPTQNPAISPAAATSNTIYVNEKSLNHYSLDAQQFILAHEMQHMINLDSWAKYEISKIIKEKNIQINETDPDSPVNQFSRFCETRADIDAATAKPEIAHGYVEFTQKLIMHDDYNPGTTHPKDKDRLTLAQAIYSTMTQTT